MIRVWIERSDGSTFCGVVLLADGSVLLWSVVVEVTTQLISYRAGTRIPFPGPWVRPTTEAIFHAVDKVLAGCQRRQFTLLV